MHTIQGGTFTNLWNTSDLIFTPLALFLLTKKCYQQWTLNVRGLIKTKASLTDTMLWTYMNPAIKDSVFHNVLFSSIISYFISWFVILISKCISIISCLVHFIDCHLWHFILWSEFCYILSYVFHFMIRNITINMHFYNFMSHLFSYANTSLVYFLIIQY